MALQYEGRFLFDLFVVNPFDYIARIVLTQHLVLVTFIT